MSRRYGTSEVTFDDRKERDYSSRSRYDDSYVDQEIKFRRSAPPPTREREYEREEIDIREDRTRARDPPAFLREDYGRGIAGPVVLRSREREEFDFVNRPRRRSPSPEPERKIERESITIRRDEEDTKSRGSRYRESSRDREEIVIRRDEEDTKSRGSRYRDGSRDREEIIIRRGEEDTKSRGSRYRERSRDREEIIIRRDERERSRPAPPPPPPEDDFQREEIIIRREERSRSRPPVRDDRDVERIIIRRTEEEPRSPVYEPPPPAREYDREEIIIRRDRDEDLRPPPRRDQGRPKSRERERSTVRRDDSDSEHEVVIRREKTEDRGRETEREEIIIRSRSASRSPSPARSVRSTRSTRSRPPPMEPQVVFAPQIHQEVVTHHRHIDHGYEVAIRERPRPVSRPPSPPSPPPPQPPPPPEPVREQSEERIEIRRTGDRNGRAYDEDIVIDRNERSRSVPPPAEPRYASPARRDVRYQDDFEEDYYSSRALEVPRRRAEADYTSIEISRERDNRSSGGDIGRRYGKTRDPKAGLWTEITKDLVLKEAITEMGYEYEETDEFYYVIAYLEYDDVARLVGLSEEIRKDRRKRVKEIEWESRIEPEPPRRPLSIEGPPPMRRPRPGWDRADERFYEREVIYRDRRPPPPPPPPGWRR